jgi:tetratricopeptide (TPR) repeat protein
MGIDVILQSPEAIAFLKSLGSKIVAGYLSKKFLASEPSYKSILDQAKQASIVDFQSEFPGVELFSDQQFEDALDEVATKITAQTGDEFVGLIDQLTEIFNSRELIYHPNVDTKSIYSKFFCQNFCLHLYARLYRTPKFATSLAAREALAESTFRVETSTSLDVIKDRLERIETQTSVDEKRSSSSVIFQQNVSEDRSFTSEDDLEVEQLFQKIDELIKVEGTFDEQIKSARQLLLRIPPKNLNLYAKAVNTLLGSHLRGGEEHWKRGLSEAKQYASQLNLYSKVIIAGFHNNLRQWQQSQQILVSIKRSELLTFSEKQKNSYFLILATTLFNLGKIEDATNALKECTDKDDPEYLYVTFMLASKSGGMELLSKATEVLSADGTGSRVIQAATYFLIDRFVFLQKEYGNALDALTELRPHLELSFDRVKKVLEKNRNPESLVSRDLLVCLPTIARLISRSKDALDLITLGLERQYDDYNFLQNAAACFLEENLLENALECYARMSVEAIVLNGGTDLYLFLLQKAERDDKLRELLEDVRNLQIPEIKKLPSILSICSVIGGDQFAVESQKAIETFPDEGWAILGRAEYLMQQKQFDEAIVLLEKARTKKDIKLLASVRLAKLYGNTLKNYEKALVYYEEVAKPSAPVQEKIEFVYCLYNLGRFNDVIKRVDEFDPHVLEGELQAIKGYACTELGMISEAQKILSKASQLQRDNYTINYNHAVVCRDLGLMDELTDALQNVIRIRPNDYKAHLLLSQSLFNQKRFRDAVTHARFSLLGDFANEVAHINFINIHRVAVKAFPDDVVISSKEMEDLHRDVLNNFAARFPDSKLMWPIQIPTDAEGKSDFTFLKNMIEKQTDRRSSLLSFYDEKALPVGFLKSGLNLDVYDLWCGLSTNDQDIGLVVNRQPPHQLPKQIQRLEASDGIILDGLSLLALKASGIFDGLAKLGKKLYVSSETVGELTNVRHRLHATGEGYLALGVEKGRMVRQDVSAEQMKKAHQFIDGIVNEISESFETISMESGFQPSERAKHLFEILDDEYKELWSLEDKKAIASVWADGNLIAFADSIGKQVCSIQAIALNLRGAEAINSEQYSIAIGEMVLADYRGLIFTPVDARVFISQNMNERGKYYFDKVCKGPYFSDAHSRVGFVAKVVIQLFSNELNPEWLKEVLRNALLAGEIDDQVKLLFGINLYSVALKADIKTETIDELFDSLSMRSSDGHAIDSKLCKGLIEQAVLQIKQNELNELKRKLGLPEE